MEALVMGADGVIPMEIDAVQQLFTFVGDIREGDGFDPRQWLWVSVPRDNRSLDNYVREFLDGKGFGQLFQVVDIRVQILINEVGGIAPAAQGAPILVEIWRNEV